MDVEGRVCVCVFTGRVFVRGFEWCFFRVILVIH